MIASVRSKYPASGKFLVGEVVEQCHAHGGNGCLHLVGSGGCVGSVISIRGVHITADFEYLVPHFVVAGERGNECLGILGCLLDGLSGSSVVLSSGIGLVVVCDVGRKATPVDIWGRR